jgi:hypothetical protein
MFDENQNIVVKNRKMRERINHIQLFHRRYEKELNKTKRTRTTVAYIIRKATPAKVTPRGTLYYTGPVEYGAFVFRPKDIGKHDLNTRITIAKERLERSPVISSYTWYSLLDLETQILNKFPEEGYCGNQKIPPSSFI